MIAIQHKVGVSDAIQLDRRHTYRALNRSLHPRPTQFVAIVAWEELAVEIDVAANAADNCIERHIFQPAAAADAALELMFDILERKQPFVATDQTADDRAQGSLLTRPPKIVDRGQAGGIPVNHSRNLYSERRMFVTRRCRRMTKD